MTEETEQLTRLVEEQRRENDLALERLEGLVRQNVADIRLTNERFPGLADTRDIVLQGHVHPRITQLGKGTPTHTAKEGTGYWDETNNTFYINSDGSTGWTQLGAAGAGAPNNANYLVGTAHAGLTAEIVVGTTPGGELGNTWASPTVDATHSGSAHHSNASDHAESHDYDTHLGGVPYAEVEYDDATSDPLIDADSAADGIENSAARKDHAHPKHHVKYTDSEAVAAANVQDSVSHDILGDVSTSDHHVTSRPYTYSITFGWDPQSPQVFSL